MYGLRIDVRITNVSGERLWDYDKPLPAKANLSININVMEPTRTHAGLEAPFMFTISYSPPIAHISVKGKAVVTGTPEEVENVVQEQKRNRQPPSAVIQAVSMACLTEAVMLSRSLNIPPPIPPLTPPLSQAGRGEAAGPSAPSSYTR
ncbi:MAG: hypothetical protein DRJ69_01530 [Thermoprotei archaeon]|nr:MAG: hypothetical protein DRJ69_01530 [Thermoprotei archaeon]